MKQAKNVKPNSTEWNESMLYLLTALNDSPGNGVKISVSIVSFKKLLLQAQKLQFNSGPDIV